MPVESMVTITPPVKVRPEPLLRATWPAKDPEMVPPARVKLAVPPDTCTTPPPSVAVALATWSERVCVALSTAMVKSPASDWLPQVSVIPVPLSWKVPGAKLMASVPPRTKLPYEKAGVAVTEPLMPVELTVNVPLICVIDRMPPPSEALPLVTTSCTAPAFSLRLKPAVNTWPAMVRVSVWPLGVAMVTAPAWNVAATAPLSRKPLAAEPAATVPLNVAEVIAPALIVMLADVAVTLIKPLPMERVALVIATVVLPALELKANEPASVD